MLVSALLVSARVQVVTNWSRCLLTKQLKSDDLDYRIVLWFSSRMLQSPWMHFQALRTELLAHSTPARTTEISFVINPVGSWVIVFFLPLEPSPLQAIQHQQLSEIVSLFPPLLGFSADPREFWVQHCCVRIHATSPHTALIHWSISPSLLRLFSDLQSISSRHSITEKFS